MVFVLKTFQLIRFAGQGEGTGPLPGGGGAAHRRHAGIPQERPAGQAESRRRGLRVHGRARGPVPALLFNEY